MKSGRGYFRCKLRHDEIVTIVVLAHRQNIIRKISEFFPEIRSNEFINSSISIGIVIVHHIYPRIGDIFCCLIGMCNLSIGIISLIMSKNRVIIITASSFFQVSGAFIGLCDVYQIYGRMQLGSRTQGIGQNIINEIFVILRHIV